MNPKVNTKSSVARAGLIAALLAPWLPAWAQSPALDMDNWVQFPPRPRDVPAPSRSVAPAAATPAAAATTAPASASTPASAAPVPAAAAASAPTAASAPASARDGWIRFPLRPAESLPVRPEPVTAAVPAEATPASSPAAAATAATVPPASTPAPAAATATTVPATPTAPAPAPAPAPAAPVYAPASTSTAVPQVAAPAPRANRIAGFAVRGNERIGASELRALLRPFQGLTVSEDNLRRATEAVSDLYRQKGMLALVEMPDQDLADGVAQIKVTEARFAGVVVEDPQRVLANNARLPEAMVENVQPKGALLSLPALDEAAARLAEIPGVDARVNLRPGAQPGETQAVATVAPGQAVQGVVAVDNAGARATGEVRETAQLALNNPLKMGDVAKLQLLHSEGINYHKLGYNVPLGGTGWRLGVSTSDLQYRVVTPDFEALNARGPSHTNGIDLSLPLLREARDTASLQFGYEARRFENIAADVTQSNYRGTALSAVLEASHGDGMGGETSGSLQFVRGNIDMSGSTASQQQNDAATTQTAGGYNKMRLALSHRQDYGTRETLLVSGQAQWASKNLDGSEKFFLGGAQGVRAYPTNEAGGSEGELMSLEWQRHLSLDRDRWTLAGFYDLGRITVNKNNDFSGANPANQYSLSGLGVWLGGSVPSRYGVTTWRFTAAHRLGNNLGASSNGLDQDGTRVLNRYRFSLSQSF